jgi:MFS family permease
LWGGPFRWLLLAHGFSSFAFWGFFGTVFAEAANRFGADASTMAVLGASISVPFILGALLQGILVDRWSPKWLSAIGYVILTAAIPIAWGATSLAWLYASAFLVGGAFATIEPARSALTGLLVAPADLVRANSSIAIAFQLSLVLSTLGGGVLLQTVNADAVYALSTAMGAVSILLVLGVPDIRQHGERPALSLGDLRAGGATSWRHPQLRILLLATAAAWTLINVFFVLEPLIVRQTLHRGGDALLYLWAAHGTGALVGAIAMSRSRRATGREATLVCIGIAVVGVGIVVYAGIGVYPVALVAAAIAGVGFSLFFPPMLAFIQRVAPEDQTGRVTSVFVAVQECMGLASSLAILALGTLLLVRPTVVVSGSVLGVIGLLGLRALAREGSTREHTAS